MEEAEPWFGHHIKIFPYLPESNPLGYTEPDILVEFPSCLPSTKPEIKASILKW